MTDPTTENQYIDVADERVLSDGTSSVTVRHIKTPKGERLEIRSATDAIRIDAIGLESLSWQDQDVFSDFLGYDYDLAPSSESDETVATFTISNEYADVVVRVIQTATGKQLCIEAPKKQFSLRADVTGLEALAEQDSRIFSEFLETPHGPDGHAH